MKKLFILPLIYLSAAIIIFMACNKDVQGRTDNTPSLNPTNVDLNAGVWKPILLTGPTEFAVAAPAATTTPDYIAQVNEIKTWQADLTKEEKESVKYWDCSQLG